jgi:hypothetical protein
MGEVTTLLFYTGHHTEQYYVVTVIKLYPREPCICDAVDIRYKSRKKQMTRQWSLGSFYYYPAIRESEQVLYSSYVGRWFIIHGSFVRHTK